jgi:hypothetical protein
MNISEAQRMMGIPAAYRGEDFRIDQFDETIKGKWKFSIVPLIKDTVDERSGLALFSNRTNAGKTRLAIGWLTELWLTDLYEKKNLFHESLGMHTRNPNKYRFVDCRSNTIINAGGWKAEDAVGNICYCARGIVLDDIMQERPSAVISYAQVINHCFMHKVPLAMTMNATREEFIDRYDMSIYRRYVENNRFIDVNEMRGWK